MAENAAWLLRSPTLMARLIRFAAVGGSTSAAYVLIVAGLVGLVYEPAAAALAYLVLLPVNFYAHRRATFQSRQPTRPELVQYLAMHGVTLVACTVAMWLVTGGLGGIHWVGSAVIVVLTPVMNFAMMHLWVYRNVTPEKSGRDM
jgi:putative flippase GtrA